MKNYIIVKVNFIAEITALIVLSFAIEANAGIRYIRHFEYSKPLASQYTNLSMPKKSQRVSSSKGEITLLFYSDIPDSIKTAMIVAKELWEAALQNKRPIYIDVAFEPLEDETVMTTEIGYEEEAWIPTALASQNRDQRDDNNESPDGYIVFNSEMDWNCSFSKTTEDNYNVTTMMLRGIARCLGFVSSIQQNSPGKLSFFNQQPTVYDSHLYNDVEWLPNLIVESDKLLEFATSDKVYFRIGKEKYDIFSPKVYKEGESLCYLKDPDSLMSQSLGNGNTCLDIDYKTLNILYALGWDLPSEALSIKCADIDETGIGSSYDSHTFSLENNNLKISRYQWSFFLKDNTGKYKVVSRGDGKDFTIDKISNPNSYYSNTNGDLEGKIECVYFVDGVSYEAEPFHLSLEQKPLIISVSTPIRTWNNYNFSLDFNVKYTGADKIEIRIEEEYDYNMLVLRVNEPIIAHVKTGLISGLYYSWVTIVAENKYGRTSKTLEFPPIFDEDFSKTNATAFTDYLKIPDDDSFIQVFNLQGLLVYEGTSSNFNKENLAPGLYVTKTAFHSGEYLISKIVIQ